MRKCWECDGGGCTSYIDGETRRWRDCERCGGKGEGEMFVSDYVEEYDRTKGDAIPDDIWERVLGLGREICEDYEIDPSKIIFVRGPDEWGIGTVGDYKPLPDNGLEAVLGLIADQTARDEAGPMLVRP